MNISTITTNHKDHMLNRAEAIDKFDVTQGVGSARIYLHGKLIIELDWDQDTDVLMTEH